MRTFIWVLALLLPVEAARAEEFSVGGLRELSVETLSLNGLRTGMTASEIMRTLRRKYKDTKMTVEEEPSVLLPSQKWVTRVAAVNGRYETIVTFTAATRV